MAGRSDRLIHSNQLHGGSSSREFEGREYGAGLTLILVNVETGPADHPQAAEVGAPFGFAIPRKAAEVGAPFGVLTGPVSYA